MRHLLLVFILLFSHFAFAQVVVEDCRNGIDDNGDGLIDCADSFRCGGVEDCKFEDRNFNCADGIDNDGNGDVDCDDALCDCTSIEICNNRLD
ncbi:MAG: hypothetical protein WA958_14300, partial [Tunicatimonas sp.]